MASGSDMSGRHNPFTLSSAGASAALGQSTESALLRFVYLTTPIHPAAPNPCTSRVLRPYIRGSALTLTTATVRSKSLEPGRYLDGDGLYLVVVRGGSRSWTLRTTVNGRQREFGLGSARKVSLKAARAAAGAKKEQVDHGVDLTAPVPTLAGAARIVHTLHAPSWSSPKYSHQWLTDLQNHCGGIMNVQVDRLSSAHVLSVLEPRWNSNPKLARSLRQRLSLIGSWVVAQGYLQANPAGEVLDGVLPRRKPPTRHFASTPSQ